MMSTDSTWIALIHVSPIVMSIAVLLAALIYALLKRSESPQAGNAVLAGLFLMFVARIGGVLGSVLLARSLSVQEMAYAAGILNFGSTLVSLAGLGLVVMAVFMDRRPIESQLQRETTTAPRDPHPDSNPFKSPLAN